MHPRLPPVSIETEHPSASFASTTIICAGCLQAKLKSGFKGKTGLKKVSSHKIVFRKKLYLSEPAEKINECVAGSIFS